MRDRQTCIDCAKQSPETETNYTLISAQFGWRLSRTRHADGTFMVEWRCPDCWRVYKNAKTSPDGSTPWANPPTPVPNDGPQAPAPAPTRGVPPPLPAAAYRSQRPAVAPPSASRLPSSTGSARESGAPASSPPRPPTKPSR